MSAGLMCVLVDDDPDFRDLEQHYLAASCPGVRVIDFSSAEEALRHLQKHHVDLVITEYRMPSMDGLELTAAIRRFAPHMPILVVSENDIGSNAMDAGATIFMPKPLFRKNHQAILAELSLEIAARRRQRRIA